MTWKPRRAAQFAILAALALAGCNRQPEIDPASAARLADSADGSDWAG